MWVGRIAHRMPWRRTSLRRGSDRIQAWLTLAVVVVTLAGTPWVAWRVASATYRAEVRASAWEQRHHRPVAAVLVRDAPSRSYDGDAASASQQSVLVPARWTAPDGTVRARKVSVAGGTRAGSTVTVWVDEHGELVLPPRRRNPAADATIAAMLAAVALAGLSGGIRRTVVWRLDRRRLRSWEAEWLIVGPRWSRR